MHVGLNVMFNVAHDIFPHLKVSVLLHQHSLLKHLGLLFLKSWRLGKFHAIPQMPCCHWMYLAAV